MVAAREVDACELSREERPPQRAAEISTDLVVSSRRNFLLIPLERRAATTLS